FSLPPRPHPGSSLFPYTTLFRSRPPAVVIWRVGNVFDDAGERLERVLVALLLFKPHGVVMQTAQNLVADRCIAAVGEATDKLVRSEEHTSELQSRFDLVCRLLLE